METSEYEEALKRAFRLRYTHMGGVYIPLKDQEEQMETQAKVDVSKPPYYMLMGGELETIDLIRDRVSAMEDCADTLPYTSHAAYCYGNIIKYLMRWPEKNGVEDLRKCREYIDMLIGELT